MNCKIKYAKRGNEFIIKIIPRPKLIITLGVIMFFIVPLLVAFYGGIVYIREINLRNLKLISLIVIITIITIKFLKQFYEKEILKITPLNFVYYNSFNLGINKKKYLVKNVTHLMYIGEESFTKHPLESNSFDYIGIGSGEHLVQFLAKEGNMSFIYNKSQVRFGKNIDEEDAIEMLSQIKLFNPNLVE